MGLLTENITQKWDQFKNLVRGSAANMWTEEESSPRLVNANDESITNFFEDMWKAYLARQNERSFTSKHDSFKNL